MTKRAKPAEATATAKYTTTAVKPDQVLGSTQKAADIVKQNAAYGAHPELQQGVLAWIAAAQQADQTSQKLKAAHTMLAAVIVALATDMAAWKRATNAVVAIINTICGGSAAAIAQFGLLTTARQVAVASTDPPAGLRVTYTRALVMVLRWAGVRGHRGYLVQVGDGTPQGWGTPISCPKANYAPTGLAPGQKVAFRVAVQRKNGQSTWSDALIVTAR